MRGYLFCLLLVSSLVSADEILLTALFPGRAALSVADATYLFSVGETHAGITLVESNEDYAVIRVNGKEQKLLLHSRLPIQLEQNVFDKHATALSHIIAIELQQQTNDSAIFNVEYYYNPNQADTMTLTARTLWQGEFTDYWVHSYTPLKPGRNTTTITLTMHAAAEGSYISDAVRFDLNWIKDNKNGITGTRIITLRKHWQSK